jgi:hypothetical protein
LIYSAALFVGSSEALSAVYSIYPTYTLDFEGLQDNEPILQYYDGGYGGLGSGPGPDYGVTFGSDALALIDADAGGSGNFGGEPSPSTAMYFLTGSAILNVPAGFNTGFSFSYTAINEPGTVVVYAGPNATGNVLSTINLNAINLSARSSGAPVLGLKSRHPNLL